MSTYYFFGCKKCMKMGGFFSRQVAGTHNADLIDSFRFILKHANCGNEEDSGIFVFNEHQESFSLDQDESHDLLGYFPHSNDYNPEVSKKKYNEYKEYINIKTEKEKS